jgi:3-phenylpropionate/cinnamic acid dioxygenase small subunit
MATDQISQTDEALQRLLLVREIEDFLYAEADLLDERRYDEWLALLTDDVRYWMPLRRNVKRDELEHENTRPGQDINWFDEGKTTLEQRVRQIQTGLHWAEEPPSRVCHLVSNVSLVAVDGPEVTVRCRFLVYRNRLQDDTDFFVGKRQDTLRAVDGAWKLARREIYLDQTTLLAKNITFFF